MGSSSRSLNIIESLRIQVCPIGKGLYTPIHSYSFGMGLDYSFGMGLEPSILFDREGLEDS